MTSNPRKTKKNAHEEQNPLKAYSHDGISSLLVDIPGFKQDLPSRCETRGSLTSRLDEMDFSVPSPDEGGFPWLSGDICEHYMNGKPSPHPTDKLRNLVWEQIASQSDDVRVKAIDVLDTLRDRTNIPVFAQALSDDYWEVRAAAAQALGELREQTLVPLLLDALQNESDFTVLQSLVRALGKCRQQKSIMVLTYLLRDLNQSWMVREAAAWSLGKFGRTVPIWPLLEVLWGDPDEMVRAAVAHALGEIEQPGAKPLLVEAMRRDDDEDVREAAKWALQQLEKTANWQKVWHWLSSLRQKEQPFSESGDDWQAVHQGVLFAFTRFIRNKRGSVSHVELVHCDQQPTLLLSCYYQQMGQTLRDEVISQFEKIIPIEPMGSVFADRGELLQEVQRHLAEIQTKHRWYETTIVIVELRPSGEGPTRAVLCGIGCHAVGSNDSLVLDQLQEQWRSYFSNLQEVRRLQIGYQSCDTISS